MRRVQEIETLMDYWEDEMIRSIQDKDFIRKSMCQATINHLYEYRQRLKENENEL